jgi:hypothetical protein
VALKTFIAKYRTDMKVVAYFFWQRSAVIAATIQQKAATACHAKSEIYPFAHTVNPSLVH